MVDDAPDRVDDPPGHPAVPPVERQRVGDGVGGELDEVAAVAAAGASGFNFEDQIIGTATLRPVQEQAARVRAARRAADGVAPGLYLNARTDIFLKIVLEHDKDERPEKLAEEICRRIEKLYGVRSTEVSSVVTQGRND